MMLKQAVLTNFTIQRPQHESSQAKTLEWLLKAHIQAETTSKNLNAEELATFKKTIKDKLLHVSCGPQLISKRGHETTDYLSDQWEKMELYTLNQKPAGEHLTTRMKKYREVVRQVFKKFYEKETVAPHDLIHVSCTGYVAPSGAQELVSQKSWNSTVTHCYHMGCYGAVPALRMARGFLNTNTEDHYRADIVHTELCSLHTNPSQHDADKLVSQSLFADGHIRYQLKRVKSCNIPHYTILGMSELIIPNSSSKMTWDVNDWGFQFFLSKEVPILIARHLNNFLQKLCLDAKLSPEILNKALFAIHPGGPKILDFIKSILKQTDKQLRHSYEVLYNFGNMSSATLPHIWEKILREEESNPYIISLAFGPGLSICGSLLKKEVSSS